MGDKGHVPLSKIVKMGCVPNFNVASLFSSGLVSLSIHLERGCSLGVFASNGVNFISAPDSFWCICTVCFCFDPGFNQQRWAIIVEARDREFKVVVLGSLLSRSEGEFNLVDVDIATYHIGNEIEGVLSVDFSIYAVISSINSLCTTEIGEGSK